MNQLKQEKIRVIPNGSVSSPKGFQAGGIHCGIRKKKKDLGLIISAVPAVSAAVYTLNIFQAAPIQVTKESLADSPYLQAVIVNSGNANAYTGEQGLLDAYEMRDTVAKTFDLSPMNVAVSSTGVIGERLPMERIVEGIAKLPDSISSENGLAFGEAILTTDTFVKSLAIEIGIEGKKITIGGTAKGSGMIHPNMATMLAFITTDANIHPEALQKILRDVTDQTFNMITVDGDTSTNDMVLAMANGLAGNTPLNENHPEWEVFYQGFTYIAQQLAKWIAKDGEGATKLVSVKVDGASSLMMAKTIAKKIVGSNLVKAALYGADGNWGRIIVAIGNSGYPVDPHTIDITLGPIMVLKNGQKQRYEEEEVTEALSQSEVEIQVDLHLGEYSAEAWGCDLTYEYVRINATYRT
ncbi:bifunctional ornithine acetyltransferase/N-acetylglutamate synthase [Tepidibacillus sp. LV47]|uniref:bifunctional ornithine acetyltransferase/N-acetylglutamate synthase n=1 Tax=Tepidibacillus sp. LV47 TaxID=3398228 RepID=UPI003AB0CF48